MKVKLSLKEWVAIGVAMCFVAYSLFGGDIMSLFGNNNKNIMVDENSVNVVGDTNENVGEVAVDNDVVTNNPVSRNGVVINDLVVGKGAAIATGKMVALHYILSLQDGTVLQNSKDFGQPFVFTYGVDSLIQGWNIGIEGMRVGGTRTIVIPPELGYGAQQAGPVPPNSTLVFTIELLDVTDVPNQ